MKKVVLMFVAIAAISFASCGNNAQPAANAEAETVDTTVVDTAAADTTVADTAVVSE